MINLEDGLMNFILYQTVKSFYFFKIIGYYYIQNKQSITIKPTESYDNKIKFIFINWILVFEYTKNNKYEKKMFNDIFKRLYKYLKRDFKLITKNFKFYDDIINRLLNCKYTKRRNRIVLNKMKNIEAPI